MSTIRTPTGPHSKSVYWRRRIVVLLVLVAVIAIIAIIAWPRGGGETPTPAGGGSPAATGAPTPGATAGGDATQPSAPPVDGDVCDPKKIDITAETDATTYEAGVNPQLWLTVTSRQTTPCVFAVGTDLQEFRITSGSDAIWSSTDCQTDPQPYEQLLEPGIPVSTTPITWDRTRSSPDTCDAERAPVGADGASYHLEVQVGDLVSKQTKQFMLY